MKRIILLSIVTIFTACQEYDHFDNSLLPEKQLPVVLDKDVEPTMPLIEDPVIYLEENNFAAWTKIESLVDRFSACDISAEQARMMTTDAIVRSILKYPLNYIIFAYNDPIDAVKLVLEHSHIHQELVNREDAAEIILKYFEKTDIDMGEDAHVNNDGHTYLDYSDEMYFEYLLSADIIKSFDSSSLRKELVTVAEKKMLMRRSSRKFGNFSTIPLEKIIREYSSVSSASNNAEYVYTYFGQALGATCISSEMSPYDVAYITNEYVRQYPLAELVRPASNKYNCHSYAWYDQSENNRYWITSMTGNNTLQLQRYWTDDYYYSTSSEDAEKVFYASGDHSAIALSANLYISKWGSAPLMKHAPTYCPYITSNRQYFKHRTALPYDITSHIIGDMSIPMNTIHHYSLPHPYPAMDTCYWTMEPFPGMPDAGQLTINSDRSCSFSANEEGAYYLYCEGYRNGEQVIAGYSIIIVHG